MFSFRLHYLILHLRLFSFFLLMSPWFFNLFHHAINALFSNSLLSCFSFYLSHSVLFPFSSFICVPISPPPRCSPGPVLYSSKCFQSPKKFSILLTSLLCWFFSFPFVYSSFTILCMPFPHSLAWAASLWCVTNRRVFAGGHVKLGHAGCFFWGI